VLIRKIKKIEFLIFLLFSVCLLLIQCKKSGIDSESSNLQADTLSAFPGAEGFGSKTGGGRRGKVIEVTNLYPNGPGSFLEACKTSVPRIVVFRTGGIIKITQAITIISPYITIAGQTAPGDGICIQGADLVIATHDVIVRGLRIRVGDNPEGPDPEGRDGIEIANEKIPPYNVIIDHCSVSWAIDENISTWYPCHDITIQWCITSEALDSSLHPKGPHSKGMLIGPEADNISIHHNLFVHNVERNPLISVDTKSELINNVIYNWKSRGLNLGNCYPENGEKSDVIGNYFKKGPNSNTLSFQISDCWAHSKVYVKGNIGPGRLTDNGDEWSFIRNDVGSQLKSSVSVIESLMKTIHPVSTAYDLVLEKSGAIIPKRDQTDTRIINEVRNGTGKTIDSQADVGGWQAYNTGIPPDDTDHDGMPDDWEIAHGLNPTNFADRHNTNLSPEGYTNIEVYINGLFDSSH
jgi:pectate lyase